MSQLEKEVYNEFKLYKIKLNKNALGLGEEISKGANYTVPICLNQMIFITTILQSCQ